MAYDDVEALAWQLLLAARDITPFISDRTYHLHYDHSVKQAVVTETGSENSILSRNRQGQWSFAENLPASMNAMFNLYLPILGPVSETGKDDSFIVAHMGQSIDSRIATLDGDSFYVTGEENRKHLHCLRALCDAVIVGGGTVVADNPQLTTRAVPGLNPVRVLIDPQARLREPLAVFDDAQANTLLLHQSSADMGSKPLQFGPEITDRVGKIVRQVQRCVVPDSHEVLSMSAVVKALHAQGLNRLFVEGGGVTVSRFLKEDLLDRLHVAIAPVIVGEGIPALQTAGVTKMVDAMRAPHAVYRMGEDILWDFEFDRHAGNSQAPVKPTASEKGIYLERII